MPKRKGISQKIRFEVFKRDKFTCQYCGVSAPDVILHVDHIEPVSKGGTNDIINLITSCRNCNFGKKARRLSDNEVIKKQKEQLDELEESRQQRRMMLEWRKSLLENANEESDDWCEYFSSATGFSINKESAFYKKTISSLIKKYGFKLMIDAIDAGIDSYFKNGIQSECEKIIDKIGGIAYNLQQVEKNPFYMEATKLYFNFEKICFGNSYTKYDYRKHNMKWNIGVFSFYLRMGISYRLLYEFLRYSNDPFLVLRLLSGLMSKDCFDKLPDVLEYFNVETNYKYIEDIKTLIKYAEKVYWNRDCLNVEDYV